jgi:hypothetical protein
MLARGVVKTAQNSAAAHRQRKAQPHPFFISTRQQNSGQAAIHFT